MTRTLALGRLLWRPATLLGIFPVFLVVIWPGIIYADKFDRGLQIGTPEAISAILWVEAIVLMSLLGAYLGGAAVSAHQPIFAFTVPSLRSTVLRQKLIAGVAASLLIGMGIFFTSDSIGSIAAFSCALVFFALGTSLSDPAFSGTLKMIGGPLVFGAAVEAGRVIGLFQSQPAVFSSVSLLAAAAILYREQSIHSARARALFQPPPAGYALGIGFKLASSSSYGSESSTSTARPAVGTTLQLFNAMHYETFGSRRFGWTKTLMTTLVILCTMAYLSANPSMVGTLGLMMISMQTHRLNGRWPYPISRKARANLAFVSGLVDTLPYFALGLLIMMLLNSSGIPRLEFFRNAASRTQDLSLIPLSFIWSPVAIWTGVTGKARTQKETRAMAWNFRRFAQFFAAATLSVLTLDALKVVGHFSVEAVEVAAAVALAVAVQGAFWLALRRHYTRKDLV